MSTHGSILYHCDEEKGIKIHIFDEVEFGCIGDIRLEVETEHATINVPWPKGLTKEQVLKLSIQPGEYVGYRNKSLADSGV
jgi:hypothetical protein